MVSFLVETLPSVVRCINYLYPVTITFSLHCLGWFHSSGWVGYIETCGLVWCYLALEKQVISRVIAIKIICMNTQYTYILEVDLGHTK